MEVALVRQEEQWLKDDRDYGIVLTECEECGNEIYVDEDHYNADGYTICEDCWMEFSDKRFKVRGEC